jgi:iron transport multicopper oxidase
MSVCHETLLIFVQANYIVKMTTDMLTGNIPSESARTVIGKLIYSLIGSLIDMITDLLTLSWQPASTFDDFSAAPLDGQKLLSPVDNKIELATNQTYFANIGTRIGMGPQPWVPAKVPSLYTALTTGSNALDPATYGVGVDPHVVKSGQVVQIHYQNTHPYPHPMHLHVSLRSSTLPARQLILVGSRLSNRRQRFRIMERCRKFSSQRTRKARRCRRSC